MNEHARTFAWDLFTELRKELVELQKIRAQILGFKYTLIGAGIAVIAGYLAKEAHPGDVAFLLLFVPALAAPFFDVLIHSYSLSIKRTGYYCRAYLEPLLRAGNGLPSAPGFLMWEEFMSESSGREPRMRTLILVGTLGTTLLMAAPALATLPVLGDVWYRAAWFGLTAVWALACALDVWATLAPIRFWSGASPQSDALADWLATGLPPRPGVGVLVVRGREVLLARRKFDPAKGELDLIGGFVNANETADHAAAREVEEETGLVLRGVELLGTLSDVYGPDRAPTLNLIYVAAPADESAAPVAASDAAKLEWCSLDDLPAQMAFPHQHRALDWLRAWASRPR